MPDQNALFAHALGLTPPWKVTEVVFSKQKGCLDIYVDFERGASFNCPVCGKPGAKAYDTEKQVWRHLDFFQYQAYIIARVPRVECKYGCGVRRVEVPWAQGEGGFTLLFEAHLMRLAKDMPMAAVARLLNEHDTRLWRVVKHYVEAGRARADFSGVTRIGVDETSARKGHDYITLFVDLDKGALLFATPGRAKDTITAFVEDFIQHNGNPEAIKEVCCDLSPAFIAGLKEHLPHATIVLDRYHLMQIVNQALDEVRRQESRETDLLKKTRYQWLKNPANLTSKQKASIETLSRCHLKTGRAYRIKLAFQDLFTQSDRESGEAHLKRWYFWATHSRLQPMIEAAKTIKRHWEGVVSWFNSRISNGLLEGTNSLLQAGKAKARGYRNKANFITISYLIAGNLDFGLPT